MKTLNNGNMVNSEELTAQGLKTLISSFAVGEVCDFMVSGPCLIKRVIFEAKKVRYDVVCLNGLVLEGVYSQHIYPLSEDSKGVLSIAENKDWVKETRDYFQK